MTAELRLAVARGGLRDGVGKEILSLLLSVRNACLQVTLPSENFFQLGI